MHALPSLQAVPFAATGFEQEPVPGSHVPAVWHVSLAEHVTGLDPVQVPLWQVSLFVHALPSLHAVPLARAGLEQVPVLGLHAPTPWHWSLAVQLTGFVPVHVPFWQESVRVHPLPSLHAVPLAATGLEHAPVLGLHVPAAWHWSLATHATELAPTHTPPWHESTWVHALPSLQDVPLAATGFVHAPLAGLHTPAAWHWSLAAQITLPDAVQTPAWQLSPSVHALPSLHDVPFAATGFEHAPVAGSQVPAA